MEGASVSLNAGAEIEASEKFSAAMRGQVIGGGGIVSAEEQARASGLSVQDSVELSAQGLALAAAPADTE